MSAAMCPFSEHLNHLADRSIVDFVDQHSLEPWVARLLVACSFMARWRVWHWRIHSALEGVDRYNSVWMIFPLCDKLFCSIGNSIKFGTSKF